MSRISTHILDIAHGAPATNVPVQLEREEAAGEWRVLASAETDHDGRCANLLTDGDGLRAGLYRLVFDTASYYAARKIEGLYPLVQITFIVRDGETHFHIPLLLAQNGYTTYRGSSPQMAVLGENRYGKSRVRVARVKRTPERHEIHEWTVEVLLRGDFETCFTEGDNTKILPTDTMKNTVYSLARKSSAGCMEEFAKELIDFLLGRNPQVSSAEVSVSEKAWEHLRAGGGKPHPTTFVQPGGERQTTRVERAQGAAFSVVSGLENLVIMKTAGSAFEAYIKDSLTTLPESADRLFGTAVQANWTYTRADLPFEALRAKIRTLLLDTFAGHASKSVQHTLYAMGEAVFTNVPEVADIELIMPNRHYLPADLSRFGQDNPNEIFVPTDEPHGTIQARMMRQR